MSYQRYQRVASLILSELNKLILREVEFPDTLITITSIDVQKDLDIATANVSVLPTEKSEIVVNNLNNRRKYLQHLLLKQINIKPMPRIVFELSSDKAS